MTDEEIEARRRKRMMWVMGAAGMGIGIGLTYLFHMEGWPWWRRIGAGFVMGLWCAYLLVLTRAGGAFK